MTQTIWNVFLKFKERAERLLKTDLTYLAKGGFWLTIGHAFASFAALALSIIFANFLKPEVYGTYKYALSIAAILAIPTMGSISTSLQRAIAKGDDGASYAALKARLWGGGLAAVISIAVSVWYFVQGNTELGITLLIIAFGMPIMESYSSYEAILQGKHKYRESTIYFVLSSFAATTALIVAIFLFHGNLYALVGTYFLSWAIVRIISWNFALKLITKKTEATKGEVATYGFRLTLIGLVSSVAGQIDNILLFHFLGPVQLAIFSFAIAIPNQLRGALSNIASLALSRFSNRSAEDIKKSIHKKALWFSLTAIPVVGAYILGAPTLYHFLFRTYETSVFPSQIFSLSLLVVPAFLYVAALQSQRAEKLIAVSDITMNIVQIILSAVLIMMYGLWGAIMARVLGRVLGTIALSLSIQYLK